MDLKAFLKPTIGKMLVFIALVAAASVPPNILLQGADIGLNYGFPLNFYGYGGGPPLAAGMDVPYYVSMPSAALDVAFWYLVSCCAMALFHRVVRPAKLD